MVAKKYKCTRCESILPKSGFWYNKTRKKIDQPCKDCRNEQKRIRRKEMRLNGKFCKSELETSYRMKGLPDDLIEIMLTKILINRELEKKAVPQVTGNNDIMVMYCPTCTKFEKINMPIPLDDLVEITTYFGKIHEECKN